MNSRRHDIYDVARHADVSITTVSRVMNSPDKVRATTRARVLAAIDELRFVPHAEAAARARKMQGRIGVVAPFFTYPSFSQRLQGVAAALTALPYDLTVYVIDSSERRDHTLRSLALTQRLDGLIVMALPFGPDLVRQIAASSMETVLIEGDETSFASINIDNAAGGALVARYFLAQGHTRCAFVGDGILPDYAVPTSDQRLAGYHRALADAGVDLPPAWVARGPHGLEPARQMAQQWLASAHPPTAIFAASDTRDLGVAVPTQLAVIGFDDLPIADYIGLTTIRQPLEESGHLAVELVLARLTDPSRTPPAVRLPLELVRRDTA